MLQESCGRETENVTLRMLLNSKGAGVIIGKKGQTVEQLRSQSGARAGVSQLIEGVNDRILTVSGTVEQISRAIEFISRVFVESPSMNFQPPLEQDCTMIRLLIPNVVMGSLIGKQGLRIRQMQQQHNVRMVAAKDCLPQSTERVTEVTGSVEGIQESILDILHIFLMEWDKITNQTVAYDPRVRNQRREIITQSIKIPEDAVGSIIGKQGTRIQEIRKKSGSQIQISESNVSDRLVTFKGTLHQNSTALQLLYDHIGKEKQRLQNFN